MVQHIRGGLTATSTYQQSTVVMQGLQAQVTWRFLRMIRRQRTRASGATSRGRIHDGKEAHSQYRRHHHHHHQHRLLCPCRPLALAVTVQSTLSEDLRATDRSRRRRHSIISLPLSTAL